MRRKSSRNAAKSSEEITTPTKKPDTPRKPTRTSKRRRQSISKSGDDSEEEPTVVDRLETIEEIKVDDRTVQKESDDCQIENNETNNHKKDVENKEVTSENINQDGDQQAEVNKNTEVTQGKSNELSNSQTEQSPSSNNIEPDTENEHVQGTHQSPSKDIAECDKTDLEGGATDMIRTEDAAINEDNFESAYSQENVVQREDDNSQYSVKSEERSLTPEIKVRKKITLKRLTSDKPEGNLSAEENTQDTSTEKESKSSRKITLKRHVTLNQEKHEVTKCEESSEVENAQGTSEVAASGSCMQSSASTEDGDKKQVGSNDEQPQEVEVKSKPPPKKIKLIRNFSHEPKTDTEQSTDVKLHRRKSTVGSSEWLEKISESMYKIDVEAIKIVCPKMKFLKEEDVKLEMVPSRERVKSESGSVRRKMSTEEGEIKETSDDQSDSSVMAHNRKISIVEVKDENEEGVKPPPSPAKNPVSEVLFITNLVRPFTIKQLRELLEKTGTIEKDGFWTDRIKSKCFVRYTSIEDAETTRNALHNEFWPVGNGKKLNVEYSTFEEMDRVMNPPVVVIPDSLPEKENREPEPEAKYKTERDLEKPTRRREAPVRQWDIGKEEHRQRSRTRTPSKERVRKHSRRSYTPEVQKKKVKKEEPVPQKLMDDLFLKTKATPSIYWQPLSPEEIAKKIHQRLVRMEEHKRRIEETRERARDGRRNQFRRR